MIRGTRGESMRNRRMNDAAALALSVLPAPGGPWLSPPRHRPTGHRGLRQRYPRPLRAVAALICPAGCGRSPARIHRGHARGLATGRDSRPGAWTLYPAPSRRIHPVHERAVPRPAAPARRAGLLPGAREQRLLALRGWRAEPPAAAGVLASAPGFRTHLEHAR